MAGEHVLRIGEVARRTGVTVSTLRAWERRYELLDPHRTDGGHRLYAEQDVRRVRAMQQLLDQGWSASAAAREVRSSGATITPLRAVAGNAAGVPGTPADELVERLKGSLDEFDSLASNRVLDDTLARLDVAAALEQVVFPVLRWIGDGWEDDPRAIAREHFASNALRPRLLRMIQSGGVGQRIAVAAAPPDEEHDLGLLGASAVLGQAGWSVRYLGAKTPRVVLEQAVVDAGAQVALVASAYPDHGRSFLTDLPDVGHALLVLGGAGFEGAPLDHVDALVHRGSLADLPVAVDRALRERSRVTS